MTPRHKQALQYAAAGIAVFPVQQGGKKPVTPHGFKDRSADAAWIDAWWTWLTDWNLALVPDDLGCYVVDLDPKHGGPATWARLCAEHNWSPPATQTVKTPSGGWHLYFKGRLPPSAGKLGPGVDVRGEGSYVLVPPSVIDGVEYVTIDPSPPAPGPEWIEKLLATPERQPRSEVDGLRWDTPRAISTAYSWVDHLIQIGDVPAEGNRNDHAFRFFTRMHGYALSEDAARELFEYFLAQSGGARPDPDPDPKIEQMVGDIWARKRGDNPPGSELPVAASGVDWNEGVIEPMVADPDADRAARQRRWRPRRMSELMTLPAVDMWDRDTDRMLPRLQDGGVCMLYGPDGHHKTNVLLAKMFELWKGIAPPRVAYAASEGQQGLGDRFRALCTLNGDTSQGKDFDDLFLSTYIPMVGQPPDMAGFRAVLKDEKMEPDIVIIDTWATALAGEDEDTRSAALLTFNGAVGKLASEYKALVIVVHHTGKLAASKTGKVEMGDFSVRGAGAYRSNVDAFLAVWSPSDRDKRAIRLYCERMKDGPEKHSSYFAVNKVGTVPVLERIGWRSFDMLTGEGRFERAQVAGALGREGWHSQEQAVSSLVLTRALYPLEPKQDPEEHERLLVGLSRQLEKAARKGSLNGLFVEAGKGLAWFATAAGPQGSASNPERSSNPGNGQPPSPAA